jgi:hypothetical protein
MKKGKKALHQFLLMGKDVEYVCMGAEKGNHLINKSNYSVSNFNMEG